MPLDTNGRLAVDFLLLRAELARFPRQPGLRRDAVHVGKLAATLLSEAGNAEVVVSVRLQITDQISERKNGIVINMEADYEFGFRKEEKNLGHGII